MNIITITLPPEFAQDIIAKVAKRRRQQQAIDAQRNRAHGINAGTITDPKLPDEEFLTEQIRNAIIADFIAQDKAEASHAAGVAREQETSSKLNLAVKAVVKSKKSK